MGLIKKAVFAHRPPGEDRRGRERVDRRVLHNWRNPRRANFPFSSGRGCDHDGPSRDDDPFAGEQEMGFRSQGRFVGHPLRNEAVVAEPPAQEPSGCLQP